MAQLIKTSGETITVTPKKGDIFSLVELQNFVGGRIQVVWIDDEHILIVREGAAASDLPTNMKAQVIAKDCILPWERIAGDVLYCDADDTMLDC